MAIRSLARSSIRQAGRVNSALTGYESNYFHHLETVRLGGTAASVIFSNLSRYSDYQHLQLRVVQIGSNGSTRMTVNGDTGSNYARHYLNGNGTTAAASGAATQTSIANIGRAGVGQSGVAIIDIHGYASTSKYKTGRSLWCYDSNGVDSSLVFLTSGLWQSTSAITSLSFINANSVAFDSTTKIALYGIKGA